MQGGTTDISDSAVQLEAATEADAPMLANLLELYVHDLSAAFPNVELGADGRFGYPQLPLYWSEPDRRFAFIVKHAGRIAGFVFAKVGSPAADAADVLDVAEFFILRRYRRSGVGREAARRLWTLHPGRWTVRVYEANRSGLSFWTRVVEEFTAGQAQVFTRVDGPRAWRVFAFHAPRS